MKQKRSIFAVILLAFLLLPLTVETAHAYTVPPNTIVYVTNTGTKYHRAGCSYLRSKNPMTIAQAVSSGYSACSRCNPGTTTGTYQSGGGSSNSSGSVSRSNSSGAYTVPPNTIVYVTNTGTKYHRDGCSYLRSRNQMTIAQATASGYSACSRCHPDTRTGTYQSGGSSSGSSGSSGSTSPTVSTGPPVSNSPSHTPSPSKYVSLSDSSDTDTDSQEFTWLLFILSPALLWLSFHAVKFAKRRREYKSLYSGKSPEELAGMPDYAEIGADGLPKDRGSDGWGDSFTFYTSTKGRTFHRKCGCSKANTPTHAALIGLRTPCKRCKPCLPDLSWYGSYKEIKAIKEQYKID